MNHIKYYKSMQLSMQLSMEFYSNIKNSGIPIMSQQEYSNLYGLFPDIDFIIQTSTSILTFKMAFKVPSLDYITENETQKFVDDTLRLSRTTGIKCYGYFIGNVKMSDKAYDILKKAKHQYSNITSFSFCCDSDQQKLNNKIIRMLYSNNIYLYDYGGDCIMIDA